MTFKFLSLLVAIVVTSMVSAACESAANTNANANLRNINSNTAVVVNANTNTMVNTNSNRWNANITREEFEKNRDDYEKERGSSTIGQGANDMWLWVKTKSSLATTDDLRDSTINVDVVNDVVTLKGTVGSAAEKASAEKVAKAIEGVKSVKNELKVSADDSMMDDDDDHSNTRLNTNRR